MRYRVTQKTLRAAAFAGLLAGAAALSGCSSMGMFADRTTTGSTSFSATGDTSQPMPGTLGSPSTRVASRFIPPSDIGGSGTSSPAMAMVGGAPGSVSSEDLPSLSASTSQGTLTQMPAQSSAVLEVASVPEPVTAAPAPQLVSVPSNAYAHVIESGESLYTIARRYDVTAQAIVQANGLSSPDKIYVGQKVIIPGRPDLLAAKGPARPVVGDDRSAAPIEVASIEPNASSPIGSREMIEPVEEEPAAAASVESNRPLVQPKVEPVLSGADKFRWPVSGRVLTDFANSKATGINIEAPEGAAIRAAENGQVIYVGNGVEGYGNLILIRHPNGYVSAYAHLKDTKVGKGDVVSRGDQIGTAGMTGSVSRPQLHFELRKGATPVDPIPLLAS
jgi:murein DD-endopeptidase MepM/ murein hydrolase activator NlpD